MQYLWIANVESIVASGPVTHLSPTSVWVNREFGQPTPLHIVLNTNFGLYPDNLFENYKCLIEASIRETNMQTTKKWNGLFLQN